MYMALSGLRRGGIRFCLILKSFQEDKKSGRWTEKLNCYHIFISCSVGKRFWPNRITVALPSSDVEHHRLHESGCAGMTTTLMDIVSEGPAPFLCLTVTQRSPANLHSDTLHSMISFFLWATGWGVKRKHFWEGNQSSLTLASGKCFGEQKETVFFADSSL